MFSGCDTHERELLEFVILAHELAKIRAVPRKPARPVVAEIHPNRYAGTGSCIEDDVTRSVRASRSPGRQPYGSRCSARHHSGAGYRPEGTFETPDELEPVVVPSAGPLSWNVTLLSSESWYWKVPNLPLAGVEQSRDALVLNSCRSATQDLEGQIPFPAWIGLLRNARSFPLMAC